MTNNETTKDTKLKRELGLGAAIAIIVGNMIGSGIFTSAQSLAQVANPMTTILAWVITGGGSVLLALSFARLGTLFPETGDNCIYRESFWEIYCVFGSLDLLDRLMDWKCCYYNCCFTISYGILSENWRG